jgi:hypothetical protein
MTSKPLKIKASQSRASCLRGVGELGDIYVIAFAVVLYLTSGCLGSVAFGYWLDGRNGTDAEILCSQSP